MNEEVPSPDPVGQDPSAEETEVVLGLDADGNHMVMLSVIPGGAEDKLSPESSSGTCGAGGEEGDLGALMVRPGQAGDESLAAGGSLADWPSSGGHVVASMDKWNGPQEGPTTGSIMGSWLKGVLSPRIHPLLGPILRTLR